MPEAYLVGGVRTPVGRYGGALRGSGPTTCRTRRARGGPRAGVPTRRSTRSCSGPRTRPARTTATSPGWPRCSPGCPTRCPGSRSTASAPGAAPPSMSAAHKIPAGDADVVVAGGVESMTRAPWVMKKPGTPWARPGEVVDTSLGWRLVNPRMTDARRRPPTITRGDRRGGRALDGITREECDAWALRSQERATRAQDRRSFAAETRRRRRAQGRAVTRDETPRPGPRPRGLAPLKPSSGAGGVVTAGNASPCRTAPLPWSSRQRRGGRAVGLTPRARVVAGASAGVAPHLMGLGRCRPPEGPRRAGLGSPTSTRSSSTRRSRRSRSPASAAWGSTRRRSTPTAGRSPSATRSAAPAPGCS